MWCCQPASAPNTLGGKTGGLSRNLEMGHALTVAQLHPILNLLYRPHHNFSSSTKAFLKVYECGVLTTIPEVQR